jgi:hypothetical protein
MPEAPPVTTAILLLKSFIASSVAGRARLSPSRVPKKG